MKMSLSLVGGWRKANVIDYFVGASRVSYDLFIGKNTFSPKSRIFPFPDVFSLKYFDFDKNWTNYAMIVRLFK